MNTKENKGIKPGISNYSELKDVFRSKYGIKYGIKHQNGLRYPDFYNVEGPYKYDLSIFDLFVRFMYDEKFSKNPKIKWPYKTEEENMLFVRELIIEQVGRRHYHVLNNPFNYKTMATFNYNHLMLCCNELDSKLTLSFDDYIKEFRTYQRPHNLSRGHAQSNTHYTNKGSVPSKASNIQKILAALYLVGSLTAMALAVYKCVDLGGTSFKEFSEMLDRDGIDEDEKNQKIISLLPDQDDKLKYINLNHFPSSDRIINEKDKELRNLLNEEGTQGLLMHYLTLVNELDETNITEEQLADYYVSSFFITQLIPEVQLCQAIDDYNEAHPKDSIPTNYIKSIGQESRELKSDPHGVYTIVYEDDTKKIITSETQDSIIVKDNTDSSLKVDTYYTPRFEESYTKAKNALLSGDSKQIVRELNTSQKLTQLALNMLTSKTEIKKTFPLLATADYNYNKSGISESHMQKKIDEIGQ